VIQGVTDLFVKMSTGLSENRGQIIEAFNSVIAGAGKALRAIGPLFDFLITTMSNAVGVIRLVGIGFSDLIKLAPDLSVITEVFQRMAFTILMAPEGILMLVKSMTDLVAESEMLSGAFKRAGIDLKSLTSTYDKGLAKIEEFKIAVAGDEFPKTVSEGLSKVDDVLVKTQEILQNQKGLVSNFGKDIELLATNAGEVQRKVVNSAVSGADDITKKSKTFFGELSGIFTDFGSFLDKAKTNLNEIDSGSGLKKLRAELNKIGPTLIGSIAKGKAGVTQAFSSIVGSIGNIIIPGLGTALQPFVELFAQGPEAVKTAIREFILAVPDFISNLIQGIPAFITAIVEALPLLIDKLINMLLKQLANPGFWLQIALSAASAFIKAIPAIVDNIFQGIKDALKGLVGNVFGSSSGGGSGIIGAITAPFKKLGSALGFAKGGEVSRVPSGYPGDSFPARLTQGEFVIDRSTSEKLKDFLSNQSGGGTGDSVTIALLNKILTTLQQPMQVSSSVTLDQRTFAEIIVNLNRTNRRLA